MIETWNHLKNYCSHFPHGSGWIHHGKPLHNISVVSTVDKCGGTNGLALHIHFVSTLTSHIPPTSNNMQTWILKTTLIYTDTICIGYMQIHAKSSWTIFFQSSIHYPVSLHKIGAWDVGFRYSVHIASTAFSIFVKSQEYIFLPRTMSFRSI